MQLKKNGFSIGELFMEEDDDWNYKILDNYCADG